MWQPVTDFSPTAFPHQDGRSERNQPTREMEGHMKLSTKIAIANEIRKESKSGPMLSMDELWKKLEPLKARSRIEMKAVIRRVVFEN